jgi:hypothetical protein
MTTNGLEQSERGHSYHAAVASKPPIRIQMSDLTSGQLVRIAIGIIVFAVLMSLQSEVELS